MASARGAAKFTRPSQLITAIADKGLGEHKLLLIDE